MKGRPHKYVVELTSEERTLLETGCRGGDWRARKVRRARILLLADVGPCSQREGQRPLSDSVISEHTGCSESNISNTRRRFHSQRLGCLEEASRSGRPRIVDGEVEAHIIAIACSQAPEGRERWTIRLIADRVVQLDNLPNVSRASVGNALKKTNLNLGGKKNGK